MPGMEDSLPMPPIPGKQTSDLHATAHVLSEMSGQSTIDSSWVLDSGATHHMTPWATLLTDYVPDTQGVVSTAVDTVVRRAGKGTLHFEVLIDGVVHTRSVKDVWHVPGLSHSLMSTQQLKRQGCWTLGGYHGDYTDYVFHGYGQEKQLVLSAPLSADGLCRTYIKL